MRLQRDSSLFEFRAAIVSAMCKAHECERSSVRGSEGVSLRAARKRKHRRRASGQSCQRGHIGVLASKTVRRRLSPFALAEKSGCSGQRGARAAALRPIGAQRIRIGRARSSCAHCFTDHGHGRSSVEPSRSVWLRAHRTLTAQINTNKCASR